MRYVKLGSTGLDVSRICLGCMSFGLPDRGVHEWTLDEEASRGRERTFVAKTFDELCDAPFECGKLLERSFEVFGKVHRMAAWDNPDARTVDWDKLAADTRTIVETEAALVAGDRGSRSVRGRRGSAARARRARGVGGRDPGVPAARSDR